MKEVIPVEEPFLTKIKKLRKEQLAAAATVTRIYKELGELVKQAYASQRISSANYRITEDCEFFIRLRK